MPRANAYLLNWLLSGEYRPGRLRQLLWPHAYPSLVAIRRNALILARIRALASVFAALTVLWIPLDLLTLPAHVADILAIMRMFACAAFLYLTTMTRRKPTQWLAYRSLVVLYAVPTVFYFASLVLLRTPGLGPYARMALEVYWALPVVAMAGLGVFPLTILESAAFSLPILTGEVLALRAHLGVFFPGGLVDAAWMMILMSGIAVFVGVSRLSFAMVLVGQSISDALTGCYSRGSVSELLDLYFKVCARVGSPLAVAFLDPDHFKEINDQFGHDAGDHVLSTAAQSIQVALRGAECAGRWGGEEFLILLPGKTAAEAIKSIEQIRASGLGRSPAGRPVTVSVGVAERIADQSADWRALVRIADQRMYAAKRAGRNRALGPQEGGIESAQVAYGS